MKKLFLILIGLALASALALGALWLGRLWPRARRLPPITVAVVIPQRGPNQASGEAIRQGLQLYLDTHDVADRLRGRTLDLRFFSDSNSTQQAVKAADDVTSANALVVLGHYFSDSALAAGDIYQKRGIPAVTASATAEAITQKSDWYFRTIPDNLFQGRFMASYVRHVLHHAATTIIFDADLYGTSLADSYADMARELEMEVQGTWALDRNEGHVDQQISALVTALQKTDDLGAIFLALHAAEAAQVVKALKLPGTSYTLIGGDALASPEFMDDLRQFPQERSHPGYYSDGIYAVAPFLADLAPDAAIDFTRGFQRQFQTVPGWEAACYYDALDLVIAAIQRAELDGRDLATDRRKLRNALAELSDPIRALDGVTGPLYFNDGRNMLRPLIVGAYEQQRLLPAYVQYQMLAHHAAEDADSEPAQPDDQVVAVGDILMTATQIVKTGLSINTISYLNLPDTRYRLDGYLWFRFQGDDVPDQVRFQNAVAPVDLGAPIVDETTGNVTLRIYRLNAGFRFWALTRFYPLDRVLLPVQFRHSHRLSASLRYVPDTAQISALSTNDAAGLLPEKGWTLEHLLQVATTAGDQSARASQFTMALQIHRISAAWLIKSLAPLCALLLLAYAAYYVPPDCLWPRLILLGGTGAAAGLHHLLLRRQLRPDGLMVIEYGMFALYILIGLAALASLGGHACCARGTPTPAARLSVGGRLLHPLLMALLGAAFAIFTMMLPRIIAEIVAGKL